MASLKFTAFSITPALASLPQQATLNYTYELTLDRVDVQSMGNQMITSMMADHPGAERTSVDLTNGTVSFSDSSVSYEIDGNAEITVWGEDVKIHDKLLTGQDPHKAPGKPGSYTKTRSFQSSPPIWPKTGRSTTRSS